MSFRVPRDPGPQDLPLFLPQRSLLRGIPSQVRAHPIRGQPEGDQSRGGDHVRLQVLISTSSGLVQEQSGRSPRQGSRIHFRTDPGLDSLPGRWGRERIIKGDHGEMNQSASKRESKSLWYAYVRTYVRTYVQQVRWKWISMYVWLLQVFLQFSWSLFGKHNHYKVLSGWIL